MIQSSFPWLCDTMQFEDRGECKIAIKMMVALQYKSMERTSVDFCVFVCSTPCVYTVPKQVRSNCSQPRYFFHHVCSTPHVPNCPKMGQIKLDGDEERSAVQYKSTERTSIDFCAFVYLCFVFLKQSPRGSSYKTHFCNTKHKFLAKNTYLHSIVHKFCVFCFVFCGAGLGQSKAMSVGKNSEYPNLICIPFLPKKHVQRVRKLGRQNILLPL